MRAGSRVVLAAMAMLSLTRCSLIVDRPNECEKDSDCPSGRVCSQKLCLAIPRGCLGNPDAGFEAAYGATDAGNAIHFGAVMGLTTGGGVSTTEIQELRAAVLAIDEMNGNSGVAGRPFVLHVCDTGDDDSANTNAKQEAVYLADQVKVPAILVSTSPRVVNVAPDMIARGVVVMSATATSPRISDLADAPDGGAGLVWRTAPSDDIQGQVLNDLLLGTPTNPAFDAGIQSASKVALVYTNDSYGQGLDTILQNGMFGGPKTFKAFSFATQADFPSVTDSLSNFGPDVTVLVAYPQDAPAFIAAAAAHPSLNRSSGHEWLFTDGAKDPNLISDQTEGSYGTGPGVGGGPAYAIFRDAFSSAYPTINPDNYAYLAYNYDALYSLMLASAYAVGPSGTNAVTGKAIADGLTHLENGTTARPPDMTAAVSTLQSGGSVDLEGASGHLSFDPTTGDVTAPIEIWQVDAGSIQHITNVEP